MPIFTMPRDRTVSTLSGHVIRFEKDQPVHVPAVAVEDVLAAGAVALDPIEVGEDEVVKAPVLDGAARKAKIIEAFEALIKRDARGDFDGAGKPHPRVVSELVGFTVDSKERNAVWGEYMQAKNGE